MRYPELSQTFAVSDVNALRKKGHDVSVWCLRRPHPDFRHWCNTLGVEPDSVAQPTVPVTGKADGLPSVRWALINLIRLHCWSQPKVMAKSLALVGSADRVSAELVARQPDVVHCFWGHYPALVALAVKLRSPSTPVTMFLGAYDLETKHALSRLAADRADWLFTHAYVNLNRIDEFGIDTSRFTVAHRGIPLDELDAPLAKNVQTRQPRILSVGAALESKGHQTVLDAFDRIAHRWPDLQCDVVGDGPYLKRLKMLAAACNGSDRIHFHGHLKRHEVMARMQQSRVLVSASTKKSERLPNVIKEAMWAGCGVVAGMTPGIGELVPNHLGELVSDNDSTSFADAIERSLSMSDDQSSITARREWIRSNFSSHASMDRYVEQWTALILQSQQASPQNSALPTR